MSKAKNRPLLITGCSSGIGLCVARALTKRGYPVYATTRREKDVVRLQAEGLKSLQLDLADSESITSAVDTILEQTDGKLYGLFNNGAYCQPGAVEDISHQVLREQFETNLFGWHQLTQRLIPVMRQQGEGRIIQNSSVLALSPSPIVVPITPVNTHWRGSVTPSAWSFTAAISMSA